MADEPAQKQPEGTPSPAKPAQRSLSQATEVPNMKARTDTGEKAPVADLQSLFSKGTKVYLRPDGFVPDVGAFAQANDNNATGLYVHHAYQYATTCRPDLCQPAAIVTPAAGNEQDVIKAVKWASDNGHAIAVRSGGHHFGGFSSTNGENIQINMWEWKGIAVDGDEYTCGAGCTLEDTDKVWAESKDAERGGAFVPHGQCSWVCVGGHLQSGGFSVDFGRSFGMFCDHVTKFRIVVPPNDANPNPQVVTVTRPDKAKPNEFNDDLWFSVVGGSPGNFGVVLDVTVIPLLDKNYPDARSKVLLCQYTKDRYQKMVELICKYSRDDDLPADFNMSVAMFQGNTSALQDEFDNNNLDVYMSKHHKKDYGDRFPWMPLPGLILTASWCNTRGKEDPYDQNQQAKDFFADLKALEDEINEEKSWLEKIGDWAAKNLLNLPQTSISPDKPIKLSEQTKLLSFPQRVQANPYLSATTVGPSNMPSTFPKWIADTVNEASEIKHAWPDIGFVVFGGKHSRIRTENCPAPSALAHRDMGFLVLYYVHYDNVIHLKDDTEAVREVKKACIANCTAVAQGVTEHIGEHKRWNMFPFQLARPDSRLDEKYFSSPAARNRVSQTKKKVDPMGVFTPNTFCIEQPGERNGGFVNSFDATAAASETPGQSESASSSAAEA